MQGLALGFVKPCATRSLAECGVCCCRHVHFYAQHRFGAMHAGQPCHCAAYWVLGTAQAAGHLIIHLARPISGAEAWRTRWRVMRPAACAVPCMYQLLRKPLTACTHHGQCPFKRAQLSSAQLSSAQLSSAQLSSADLNPGTVQVSALRLGEQGYAASFRLVVQCLKGDNHTCIEQLAGSREMQPAAQMV